jgi:hypothetical protein
MIVTNTDEMVGDDGPPLQPTLKALEVSPLLDHDGVYMLDMWVEGQPLSSLIVVRGGYVYATQACNIADPATFKEMMGSGRVRLREMPPPTKETQ